jgi:hypothetical protein
VSPVRHSAQLLSDYESDSSRKEYHRPLHSHQYNQRTAFSPTDIRYIQTASPHQRYVEPLKSEGSSSNFTVDSPNSSLSTGDSLMKTTIGSATSVSKTSSSNEPSPQVTPRPLLKRTSNPLLGIASSASSSSHHQGTTISVEASTTSAQTALLFGRPQLFNWASGLSSSELGIYCSNWPM